ncbi:MAG: phage baseplate assembly protein V [Candidatus Aenigmatarchaeota archaeon]
MNKNRFQDFRRSPDTIDNITSESLGKPSLNKIYVGIVKDNRDVEKMGRLRVYIPELGGQPGDELRWFTVDYCSPFAGATNLAHSIPGSKSYVGSQQSYGFWAIPPDLENLVVVAFINGEPNRGIWFGCLYQQYMNHMVPGIAESRVFSDSKEEALAPAVEYNKKIQNLDPYNPQRATFEPLYEGLKTQGLLKDPERGPSKASARRESPSQVYGLKTPRGHHIYIDDGEIEVDPITKKPIIQNQEIKRKETSNEYIRIRTRSGVQILINDTTGYIYMNTKEGKVWLELSDQNGVEIYTEEKFNLRAENGINIHCDKDININAEGDLNIFSGGSISIESNDGIDIISKSYFRCESESMDIINKKSYLHKAKKMSFIGSDVIGLKSEKIIQNGFEADKPDKPITKNQRSLNGVQTIVDVLPTREPYKNHPLRTFPPTPEMIKNSEERMKRGNVRSDNYSLKTKFEDTKNIQEQISRDEYQQTAENLFSNTDCDFILSEKYESNGNPAAINDPTLNPKIEGYSYGSIQISTKNGAMASFLRFLEKENPQYAAELNNAGGVRGATAGTPEFINKWKELARKNPAEFDSLQKKWNSNVNFSPTKNMIYQKYGIDLSKEPTLAAVVYSTATQHGSGGANRVIDRAFSGIPANKIKDMPREELIKRIYAERGKQDPDGTLSYFRSGTPKLQQSVKNRLIREEKDALKMLELEKENKLPCQQKKT